jgi:hypothetical protein
MGEGLYEIKTSLQDNSKTFTNVVFMKNGVLSSIFMYVIFFCTQSIIAAPDPNFHIYLLFGQSNMAGGGNTSNLIPADCDTSSRVKVLAFADCSGSSPDCNKYSFKRTTDQWYTAFPPLHSCSEGISPGDWFAKTMLDSIRSDISIGLIPCALSGQALNVFLKGRKGFNLPTWAHPTLGNTSPYDWMLNRCKLAQQKGVIKGFLFHQGESGAGEASPAWTTMAGAIFDSLKKDLGLDSKVPVVVGELCQASGVCCASFNSNIDQLAKQYPFCGLTSSKGLNRKDQYHFDAPGMREMGKRYAQAFLALANSEYVPRKDSVSILNHKSNNLDLSNENAITGNVNFYTIDGRCVATTTFSDLKNGKRITSGNVYMIHQAGRSSSFFVIQ